MFHGKLFFIYAVESLEIKKYASKIKSLLTATARINWLQKEEQGWTSQSQELPTSAALESKADLQERLLTASLAGVAPTK